MSAMFSHAAVFNQPINNWDVSSVTDMSKMLFGDAFNQPLNKWKTGKVTNMFVMFQKASAFSDQNLSTWNVTKVTNHDRFMLDAGTGNIEPIW
jgi:surface protein